MRWAMLVTLTACAGGAPAPVGRPDIDLPGSPDCRLVEILEDGGYGAGAVDGAPDSSTTNVFDEDGNGAVTEVDVGVDGTVDARRFSTWDDEDRPLTFDYDQDADGDPDFHDEWTYDVAGRTLASEHWAKVPDVPGVTTGEERTYAYDAQGHLTFETYAYLNSGVPISEEQWTHTYEGDLLVYSLERVGGEDFHTIAYDYDADDRRVLMEEDSDVDGDIDEFTTYAYDARDRVVLQEEFVSAEGGLTRREWWTYDDGDRVLTDDVEVFYMGRRTQHTATLYTYDSKGRLLQDLYEPEAGEGALTIASYEYDRHGRAISYTWDYPAGDGRTEYVRGLAYDRRGNMVRQVEDEDGDGLIDSVRDVTWECGFEAEGGGCASVAGGPVVGGWIALFGLWARQRRHHP